LWSKRREDGWPVLNIVNLLELLNENQQLVARKHSGERAAKAKD
jgi:hypothetical protein